jgi:predicted Zn-dependent protease
MKAMKGYRLRVALVLVLGGTVLCGCARNPVTGERQFVMIPEQEEIALGTQAAPEFEKEFGGPVADATLQNYVRQIGGSIATISDRKMPYEYTLLRSDIANAFALPGGKIYITAGLMSHMKNERELAAVLSHETVHVAAMHNVRGLQRQMGAALLQEIAGMIVGEDKQKVAEAATQIATGMVNLSYSRDDEYEADKYGVEYMAKAGHNPWGMVELLTTLKELHDSEPGTLGEFFQTHPLTSKRIKEAQEIVEDKFKVWSKDTSDPNAARFVQMRNRLR